MLEFHRANGDTLSLIFSPEGSLSSARLHTGDKQHDVVAALPGLTEAEADNYLDGYGWSPGPATERERAIAQAIETACPGLLVDEVDAPLAGSDGVVRIGMECIRVSDRERVVCSPAASFSINPDGIVQLWAAEPELRFRLSPSCLAAIQSILS